MQLNQSLVCIVRSSDFSPDTRAERLARFLVRRGAKVTLLGLNRTGRNPSVEYANGMETRRLTFIDGHGLPFGKPTLGPFVSVWMAWSVFQLIKTKPDIVIASDLDGLVPSLLYSKIRGTPLVYEPYDFYADTLEKPIPQFLITVARELEKRLAGISDAMIVPDASRVLQYSGAKLPSLFVEIVNAPDETDLSSRLRVSAGSCECSLRILYAGLLARVRGLSQLVQVVGEENGMCAVFAGYGADEEELVPLIERQKKCVFLGRISHERVIGLTQECDVVFAMYDPEIPNHRFASPNKLFEAMACSRPIIVNTGTRLADIVRANECGIAVKYGDKCALGEALCKLRDEPDLRVRLGTNGRKAFETSYRWGVMEERLGAFFDSIPLKEGLR